jgi:hypothetical protein
MRTDLAAPYDWINNVPDPNSQDCRNVIAWLIHQGAPPPQVSYLRLVTSFLPPTTVAPAGFWVLQFSGMPYPCDLALSLNSPTLVLQELNDNLHLNLSIPTQYAAPAPPQPPAPPSTPLPQPAIPVGQPMINDPRIGSDYFPVAGDTLPIGALFPSPVVPGQPLYQKIGRDTPVGHRDLLAAHRVASRTSC